MPHVTQSDHPYGLTYGLAYVRPLCYACCKQTKGYIMFSVSDTFGHHTFYVNGTPINWRRQYTDTGWVYLFQTGMFGDWVTAIADAVDVRRMYAGDF